MAALKGKFTFKKGPKSTGLAAIASPYANTMIRINRETVGTIYAPSRFGGDSWTVSLIVKSSEEEHGGWRWVRLKGAWENEPDARAWVLKNADAIQEKFELHSLGDFGQN